MAAKMPPMVCPVCRQTGRVQLILIERTLPSGTTVTLTLYHPVIPVPVTLPRACPGCSNSGRVPFAA